MNIVEEYRSIRLERLDLQRKVNELDAAEKKLKEQIITELKAGTPHRGVILIQKDKPIVEDWLKLYAHIKATGEFELLHRRLTEAAVLERRADGVVIPGVGWFPVFDIKVG